MFRILPLIIFISICSYASGEVQVRFVAIEAQIKEIFYLSSAGEYEELNYDPYDLSDVLEIKPREGKISLFKKVIIEGNVAYQVLAEASVRSMKNALGIIYSKGNALHLSFYDNSATSFPNSSLRLINLLPVSIYNRVGDRMVEVGPYAVEVIPIKHKKSRPIVGLISAYKKDNQLKSFFDRRVSVPVTSRLTGVAISTRGALDVVTGGNLEGLNQKLKVDYFLLRDEAEY